MHKMSTREYSQNLQHHLMDRESGYKRHNFRSSFGYLYFEREFHKSILPNLTIQNVDKPLGFLRKFTPNGQLLISFSYDKRCIEVWKYTGVGQAADLLRNQRGECITAADHSIESLRIRQQVFERLFKLRITINLIDNGLYANAQLNREFSIFMNNGRYVLLAALSGSFEVPPFRLIYKYPDYFADCSLCNYTFFLVDLEKYCISDVLSYNQDNILLSHHHGVSVYNQTIAVLSKYRQCIDLIELVNGKLVRLYTIGPFANNIDAARIPVIENIFTGSELPLSHLKQRIITHIYANIWKMECKKLRQYKLREFYKLFKIYERMIMLKMQLLDADHLLIRYEKHPADESSVGDFKLYVFYCISEGSILRVFPKSSVELLYLLRNFYDNFRNVCSQQSMGTSSSPSNNTYFRAAFNSAIMSIPGGEIEAAIRFNPTLPISTQSFATTQYLDYNIFNYDDRLISVLERPKISSLEPIRFSDRQTNITKFRIYLESVNGSTNNSSDIITNNGLQNNRELVAFIFHPFEPLIISVQKISTRYVTNFHLYNEATIVQQ